ncbi:hypothetical protein VNO77_09803 [Canavalia gladiata]|uniref:Uncharacterized protein n=1 Tax=Canavalia gladiata TaxID=3824 RepID=A0AAN9MAB3_CANGL
MIIKSELNEPECLFYPLCGVICWSHSHAEVKIFDILVFPKLCTRSPATNVSDHMISVLNGFMMFLETVMGREPQ